MDEPNATVTLHLMKDCINAAQRLSHAMMIAETQGVNFSLIEEEWAELVATLISVDTDMRSHYDG